MNKILIMIIIAALCLFCCSRKKDLKIIKEGKSNGYSEVIVVKEESKDRLIISGQIGQGITLEEQLNNVFLNLRKQLQGYNGDFKDLVKINTYIVDYKEEDLKVFRAVRRKYFKSDAFPASTLIGVKSLAKEDWLVEIEAEAIIK